MCICSVMTSENKVVSQQARMGRALRKDLYQVYSKHPYFYKVRSCVFFNHINLCIGSLEAHIKKLQRKIIVPNNFFKSKSAIKGSFLFLASVFSIVKSHLFFKNSLWPKKEDYISIEYITDFQKALNYASDHWMNNREMRDFFFNSEKYRNSPGPFLRLEHYELHRHCDDEVAYLKGAIGWPIVSCCFSLLTVFYLYKFLTASWHHPSDLERDEKLLDILRSKKAVMTEENSKQLSENCDSNSEGQNKLAMISKRKGPITVNGQNINDIIKQGQALVCMAPIADHFLALQMKDGNMEIESFTFANSAFVQGELARITERKAQSPQVRGRIVEMKSNSLSFNGSWATAEESMILEGRAIIRFVDRFLHSKKIELIGNKMEFDRCYIDTDELIIQTNVPGSCCKIIRVTFKKDSSVLKGLQGCIDFANNETYGDYDLRLMGVEKIEIQFAPHAF